MQLSPLLEAVPPIPSHALAAGLALAMGLWPFLAGRPAAGNAARHGVVGYIFVASLAYVALSGFFINEIRTFGPFSGLHVFSVVTLAGLAKAVLAAKDRKIQAHRRAMAVIFISALLVTGLFTLLPGRVMHAVVSG